MKRLYLIITSVATLLTAAQGLRAQSATGDVVYKQSFDTDDDMATMTVIDADGDGSSWIREPNGYNQGYAMNHRSVKNDVNDWLITPEISLDGGRVYILTYGARGNGMTAKEKQYLNVAIGNDYDYTKYTVITKDPTVDASSTFLPFKEYIHITKPGSYHIGFNDISKYDTYPTYLDDIRLVRGPLLTAPDSVASFTATAGANGAATATITFTTPRQQIDGTAITSLTRVSVLRGQTVVRTFDNPAPGSELTFTDTAPGNGDITYTVVAANANGDGIATERTTFVGEDYPSAPTNTATTDYGDKIELSWNAPTTGANGHYINPGTLKYNVYLVYGYSKKTLVAEGVSGTSVKIDNNYEGEQTQNDFEVSAISARGEGKTAKLPSVILGTPYTLPFVESFANGKRKTMWWTNDGGIYGGFFLATDRSYDGDGGCATYSPVEEEEWAELNTGKISLRGSNQPTLKFCCLFDTYNNAKLEVFAEAAGKKPVLLDFFRRDVLYIDWQRATIDLSQFKDDPYVILHFRATSGNAHDVCFDNVSVSDGNYDNDLAVTLSTHTEMVGGEKGDINVHVANYGNNDSHGYTVELLADGEVVDTQVSGERLEPMQSETKTFSYRMPVTKDHITFQAHVIADIDDYDANNTSAETTVSLSAPVLTPVNGLSLTRDGSSTVLSWTKPESVINNTTEDFESYTPFTIPADNAIGPWSLIDGDQSWTQGIPVKGSETGEVVAYPNATQEEAFAWMVFNPELTTPDVASMYGTTFLAHSGSQYAIAACATDIATTATSNDDWLISPLLTGEQQTISFYTMCPSTNLPESFEVYGSSASDDVADFTQLASGIVRGSDGWKKVEAQLPAGTKYFAIRYCSSDMFMMGLDDISYTTGDGRLTGYNIYRDGRQIATRPASATSFTDNAGGEHTYTITALYTRGESVPASVSTGIDGVSADIQPADTLYNVAGQRIGQAGRGTVTIVRRQGGKPFKIVRR